MTWSDVAVAAAFVVGVVAGGIAVISVTRIIRTERDKEGKV